MNSAYYRELIEKKLNGTIQADELEFLEQWYLNLNNNTNDITAQHRQAIKDRQRLFFKRFVSEKDPIKPFQIWKSAAAIILVMVCGYIFFQILNDLKPEITLTQKEEWQEVFTENGVRKHVILPDQSKVFLKANASIKFPKNFRNNRQIFLLGEAFFEITPNKESPFVVIGEKVEVTVLGTSFTVNSDNSDHVSIAVLTGKVSVKSGATHHLLTPANKMVIDHLRQEYAIQKIDLEKEFAWTRGEIIFDNTPLKEAIDLLVDWYDMEQVNWQIDPNRTKCTVTGKYRDNTLVEVLEAISYAIGMDYHINQKSLTISNNKCLQ